MTSSPEKLRVLIADPFPERRDRFVEFLEAGGVQADIVEAESVESVGPLFESGDFALTILGCGFSDRQLEELVRDAANNPACGALVVEARSSDKRLIQLFLQAGAHGVAAPPLTSSTFVQAIKRALRGSRTKSEIASHPTGTFPAVQRPDSKADGNSGEPFSHLLSQYSERLVKIAERLRAEELAGRPLTATPKLVKEVLLSAVSAVDDDSDESVERIIQALYRE